jgi:hypothetical protein
MTSCSNCGAGLQPAQTFCPKCGSAQAQAAATPPPPSSEPAPVAQAAAPQPQVVYVQQAPAPIVGTKSKVVAFVLAWLLGGFGIHKFYLGRIGQGIVYLIFFWTFIPAFIAFIEGIVYILTSDQDFARKYG